MDFIVGLPRTQGGYNTLWVIVDRLTKIAHFLPINNTTLTDQLGKLYMRKIFRLYGVPKTILLDQANFLKTFALVIKYQSSIQHNLLTTKRQSVRKDQPSVKGHVKSLHLGKYLIIKTKRERIYDVEMICKSISDTKFYSKDFFYPVPVVSFLILFFQFPYIREVNNPSQTKLAEFR